MKKNRWEPNQPRACGSTLKKIGTGGQILHPEKEEYLKKRMMSLMLCTNWVCAGTFANHEWVSARAIIEQEEGHFKRGIGFQNRCSVRGTLVSSVVFCVCKMKIKSWGVS